MPPLGIKGIRYPMDNQNYGLTTDAYVAFQATYSQQAMNFARAAFAEVELFSRIKDNVGKKNFYRLLTQALRFEQSDISALNRLMSAYRQISERTIWETIGVIGIGRVVSLPQQIRQQLIASLRNEKNLTPNIFWSLYNSLSGMPISSSKMDRTGTLTPETIQQVVTESVQRALNSTLANFQGATSQRGRRNRNRRGERNNRHERRQDLSTLFPFASMPCN